MARSQPFEMLYSLNCQNLCADFQEDLDFRFSWGITAMIQRFTGGKGKDKKAAALMCNRSNMNVSQMMLSPVGNEPNTPTCLMPNNEIITQEQLSVISKVAIASIGSQGTVGGLIVGGLVSRKVNSKWRLVTSFLSLSDAKNYWVARPRRSGCNLWLRLSV